MTSTALPADWLLGSPGRRRGSTWLKQDSPPPPRVITRNFSLLLQFVSVYLLKYTHPPLPFYYNLSNASNNCTIFTFKVFHFRMFFFEWLPSAISDCILMYSLLYIHCYVILSLRNIWLRVYVIKFIACQTRYLLWIDISHCYYEVNSGFNFIVMSNLRDIPYCIWTSFICFLRLLTQLSDLSRLYICDDMKLLTRFLIESDFKFYHVDFRYFLIAYAVFQSNRFWVSKTEFFSFDLQ